MVPYIVHPLVLMAAMLAAPQGISETTIPAGASGVRTPSPIVADLVDSGRQRSATFRTLLRDVEASDWLVFVHVGSCQTPRVRSCLLHRVGTFEGRRYLRVVLTKMLQFDDEAIGAIGHELQHALEVATTPNIASGDDIYRLFRHIGYVANRSSSSHVYETRRAVELGRKVRQELDSDDRAARRVELR